MAIDFLTIGFEVPQTVHVLGMGPNMTEEHLSKLGYEHQFTICVNRAIDYDSPRHVLWLCDDGTLPEKEWFQNCIRYYLPEDPKHIASFPIVFSEGKLLETYPRVPYYVRHSPGFYTDPVGCWPGVLRGGTSVGGKGTQLAYHLIKKDAPGPKRIVLCGIDMMGKVYANDPEGHGCNANLRRDGTWAQLPNFNRLIKWIQEQGVQVVSLSETALDIEIVAK